MKTFRPELTKRFLLEHHMAAIVVVTISSGIVANKLLFNSGVEHIILRYPLSVTASFLAFVASMRLWLEYLRRSYKPRSRRMEFDDPRALTDARDEAKPSNSSKWDSLPDLGIDDEAGCLIVLVLTLVLVVGGSAIVLISDAPLILAEVAFQFFLASGLVRSAKAIDSPSWLGSVIKHTWRVFVLILLLSVAVGALADLACARPTSVVGIIKSCG
jgi:hypothetical protein